MSANTLALKLKPRNQREFKVWFFFCALEGITSEQVTRNTHGETESPSCPPLQQQSTEEEWENRQRPGEGGKERGAEWLGPMSVYSRSFWQLFWEGPILIPLKWPENPLFTAPKSSENRWPPATAIRQQAGRRAQFSFPYLEQVTLTWSRNYEDILTCPLIQEHLLLLQAAAWGSLCFTMTRPGLKGI